MDCHPCISVTQSFLIIIDCDDHKLFWKICVLYQNSKNCAKDFRTGAGLPVLQAFSCYGRRKGAVSL